MKMNIYSVKDLQVDAFASPFFMPTNGAALRAFADHVNENGTPANKHPGDFALYHLGVFDDQTGDLTPCTPNRIGQAAEYKEKLHAV